MKKIRLLITVIAGLCFFALQGQSQTFKADDIKGYWLNEDKDAKIEVFIEEGKYYGNIVWLETPIDEETGKPKLDDENPEEELQSRPVMGLQLLKDFTFSGEDRWEDGTIYDPKNGKTYKCRMTMENIDLLYIRGYIGKAWMGLGRTTEWTRTTIDE